MYCTRPPGQQVRLLLCPEAITCTLLHHFSQMFCSLPFAYCLIFRRMPRRFLRRTQKLCLPFRETFCWLPLAFCLSGKVLVLHGGLFSRDDVTLDDIRKEDRCREPPDRGIMCECLWSDPQPEAGRAPSKRGCGIQFGARALCTSFLACLN